MCLLGKKGPNERAKRESEGYLRRAPAAGFHGFPKWIPIDRQAEQSQGSVVASRTNRISVILSDRSQELLAQLNQGQVVPSPRAAICQRALELGLAQLANGEAPFAAPQDIDVINVPEWLKAVAAATNEVIRAKLEGREYQHPEYPRRLVSVDGVPVEPPKSEPEYPDEDLVEEADPYEESRRL